MGWSLVGLRLVYQLDLALNTQLHAPQFFLDGQDGLHFVHLRFLDDPLGCDRRFFRHDHVVEEFVNEGTVILLPLLVLLDFELLRTLEGLSSGLELRSIDG